MQFIAESTIRTTPERLYAFHELPDALERLTPEWVGARVVESARSLAVGSRSVIDLRLAPLLWMRTEWLHTACEPPSYFEDQQRRGPFRSWRHRHAVLPAPEGARLVDTIDFEPPFPPFGRWLAPLLILPRLRKVFAYRHEVTRAWCEEAR